MGFSAELAPSSRKTPRRTPKFRVRDRSVRDLMADDGAANRAADSCCSFARALSELIANQSSRACAERFGAAGQSERQNKQPCELDCPPPSQRIHTMDLHLVLPANSDLDCLT